MTRRERIERKLAGLEFPAPGPEADMDRIGGLMFRRSVEWMARYCALLAAGIFEPEPLFRNHGETAIGSARERVPWRSCQATQHAVNGEPWAEVDVDLANPRMGGLPAGVHVVWDCGVLGVRRWWRKLRHGSI